LSSVTLPFDDGTDLYFARQQVSERLAGVDVPDGVKPSLGPLSTPTGEIFRYTLEGPGYSPMQLREVQDEENISGVNGQVAIKLFGDDLDALRQSAVEVKRTLEQVPGVADLAVVHSAELPQVHVVVDRKAIARYGLNIADVQDVVETAIGGQTATTLWEGERHFDVAVRLAEAS